MTDTEDRRRRRVTPYTAVRGLVGTVIALLALAVIVIASPALVVVFGAVFVACIVRSDTWAECWDLFSDGFSDLWRDAFGLLRDTAQLWTTEE